jgi:hypothetical protein
LFGCGCEVMWAALRLRHAGEALQVRELASRVVALQQLLDVQVDVEGWDSASTAPHLAVISGAVVGAAGNGGTPGPPGGAAGRLASSAHALLQVRPEPVQCPSRGAGLLPLPYAEVCMLFIGIKCALPVMTMLRSCLRNRDP